MVSSATLFIVMVSSAPLLLWCHRQHYLLLWCHQSYCIVQFAIISAVFPNLTSLYTFPRSVLHLSSFRPSSNRQHYSHDCCIWQMSNNCHALPTNDLFGHCLATVPSRPRFSYVCLFVWITFKYLTTRSALLTHKSLCLFVSLSDVNKTCDVTIKSQLTCK